VSGGQRNHLQVDLFTPPLRRAGGGQAPSRASGIEISANFRRNPDPFPPAGNRVISNPSEICIYEDNPHGHRLGFLEIIVKYIFVKTGRPPLLLLTQEIVESLPYGVFLKGLEGKFESIILEKKVKAERFSRYRAFSRAVRYLEKKGVRRILVPTANELVKTIGIARLLGLFQHRLEIRGLTFYLPLAYPDQSFFQRLKNHATLWLEQKSSLVCFYGDEFAVETANQKYGLKLPFIPDPPFGMEAFRAWGPKTPEAGTRQEVCFGSLGDFWPRKGAEPLVEAFLRACFKGKPKLLLAGTVRDHRLSLKIKAAQEALGPDRVLLREGFLTNEEFRENLRQMDVVCMPYEYHQAPSGIFTQAAMGSKIIIAPDFGWMGWEGRKYNKTRFFKHCSLDSLVETMEDTERCFAELDQVPGKYAPASPERFAEILCGF
jgi:hypothetical protein